VFTITAQPDLSIVIPTWNEATRLPRTLAHIRRFGQRSALDIEIIVADDGSEDDTRQIALRDFDDLNLRVVGQNTHFGPGVAVQTGIFNASGQRILLYDADGPVHLDELEGLWKVLDAGADIAVGSRLLVPEMVHVRQPMHRIIMGKVWYFLVHLLSPSHILDTQCGFKLFTQSAAQSVFTGLRSTGFAFHVEILNRARENGLTVVEMPVHWRDVGGSKIKVIQDSAQMLRELTRLAWSNRTTTSPKMFRKMQHR